VKKSERKFAEWCAEEGVPAEYQPAFEWCQRDRRLPFDFRIGNYIIEIDGEQHFRDVKGWNSKADEVREVDIFKMKCALDNGFDIIRVYQPDLWNDTVDWKQGVMAILMKPLEEVGRVHIVAKNNSLYDRHLENVDT
jgi:hypothetical protein